jgi:hypothetical protein
MVRCALDDVRRLAEEADISRFHDALVRTPSMLSCHDDLGRLYGGLTAGFSRGAS